MYIICKKCKKKLSQQDFINIAEIDRHYEQFYNMIWGCTKIALEIKLDNESLKMPYKSHMINNYEVVKMRK